MDTQTMNVEIGRRIAEIRKAASEKQETTAQYLNMVRSNYTKKELGQSAFSPYELAKLAEHLALIVTILLQASRPLIMIYTKKQVLAILQ